MAGKSHEERRTVWRGTRNQLGANDASRAQSVVHDGGHTGGIREPLSDQACKDVYQAAWAAGHHDADWARGKARRSGGAGGQRRADARGEQHCRVTTVEPSVHALASTAARAQSIWLWIASRIISESMPVNSMLHAPAARSSRW